MFIRKIYSSCKGLQLGFAKILISVLNECWTKCESVCEQKRHCNEIYLFFQIIIDENDFDMDRVVLAELILTLKKHV